MGVARLEVRARALTERLLVEFANSHCERGEELVRELRDFVEDAGELARAEHEHGALRLRRRGRGARSLVEQRQFAAYSAGNILKVKY